MKCCYCGRKFFGYGHNPYDWSKDFYTRYTKNARCCEDCNYTVVIPSRLNNLTRKRGTDASNR